MKKLLLTSCATILLMINSGELCGSTSPTQSQDQRIVKERYELCGNFVERITTVHAFVKTPDNQRINGILEFTPTLIPWQIEKHNKFITNLPPNEYKECYKLNSEAISDLLNCIDFCRNLGARLTKDNFLSQLLSQVVDQQFSPTLSENALPLLFDYIKNLKSYAAKVMEFKNSNLLGKIEDISGYSELPKFKQSEPKEKKGYTIVTVQVVRPPISQMLDMSALLDPRDTVPLKLALPTSIVFTEDVLSANQFLMLFMI